MKFLTPVFNISERIVSKTFEFSYEEAGNYSVNMTAHNLHSEKVYGHVKFTHNFTQSIIVQVPILDYTDESEEYWINDDGRKSASQTQNMNLIIIIHKNINHLCSVQLCLAASPGIAANGSIHVL